MDWANVFIDKRNTILLPVKGKGVQDKNSSGNDLQILKDVMG